MRILFFSIIFLLLASCVNNETVIPGWYPACVISLIKKDNPPVEIRSFRYNNKTVYLAVADCCDQYNYVYDENCNLFCAPSGGITGKGDGKCPDFYDKATEETLIWKKG
jgi:hypothetical protein